MSYLQINPYTHIITQPLERKKTSMELIFNTGGSWFEEDIDRGKKHLLEHCIVGRTKDLDFWQFKDYQFKQNLVVNAYTGPLTMGLEVDGHFSDFQKMLDLLLETAFVPTFEQSILDREKEIVLREITERRGDPNYRLYYHISNLVFSSDSYENHETLGNSEMVAQTTLLDFEKLHLQNQNQSHILINISGGGVDLEYLYSKLDFYLQKTGFANSKSKLPINYQVKNTLKEFSFLPIVHELAHTAAEVYVYLPVSVDFANSPTLRVFESLYLKYGGVLYDRLRDELGLVYGISSTFSKDLQQLIITLSCEIKDVTQIIDEINEVFGDFDKYFKENKFFEFQEIIQKKLDIAQDTLGSSTNFTINMLRTYGISESYDEYRLRLAKLTKNDVKTIYEDIKNNLPKKRVIVVSNNVEIEKIKID